jgi:hypothetical protein
MLGASYFRKQMPTCRSKAQSRCWKEDKCTWQVKKFPATKESEGSLLYSQYPLWDAILSLLNRVHILTPCLFKVVLILSSHLHLCPTSGLGLRFGRFPTKIVYTLLTSLKVISKILSVLERRVWYKINKFLNTAQFQFIVKVVESPSTIWCVLSHPSFVTKSWHTTLGYTGTMLNLLLVKSLL